MNRHDGPSDRATDYRPMVFVHIRKVRHPVRQSVLAMEIVASPLIVNYTE